MKSTKKILTMVLAAFLTIVSSTGVFSGTIANAKVTIPQVEFVSAPVTEYIAGDRVQFKIFAPNYSGKVEYRVVLWNDSTKSYGDLWNAANGYPTCYYTKWQPKGNDVFTLGWPIFQPGSYRITVYVKRVGVPASKAYLKGYNCDSYMESVAFTVRPAGPEVQSILPLEDIVVNQGGIPILPKTVRAVMADGTQRELGVKWGAVDTSRMGTTTVEGRVDGTTKKAVVRVIVNQDIITPNSVSAISNTSINVTLSNSIDYAPSIGRFTVLSPNASAVQIYSLIMSKDLRSFQLVTDYMTSGSWYILVVDGKEYIFNVPYTDGRPPASSTVAINTSNRVVRLGDFIDSNVVTSPQGATLYFSSSNPSVASVDKYTGRIKGVSQGAATITVVASKPGYYTGSATFTVSVLSNSQMVYAPVAVPGQGEVQSGTSIVLMTNTEGASIYYTLDGTTPTLASYRYTEPITIYTNTVIKAMAYKQGIGTSSVAAFVYTVKTTTISTNVWLKDKTFSNTNYYYINWNGPFEITLDKSSGGRRIIKLHNLRARSFITNAEKNYGDVVFTETGVNTDLYTCNAWDGIFTLDELRSSYEHCIKLTNNSSVDVRLLNSLGDYPDYIRNWFK